jgi:hypothetical protein
MITGLSINDMGEPIEHVHAVDYDFNLCGRSLPGLRRHRHNSWCCPHVTLSWCCRGEVLWGCCSGAYAGGLGLSGFHFDFSHSRPRQAPWLPPAATVFRAAARALREWPPDNDSAMALAIWAASSSALVM